MMTQFRVFVIQAFFQNYMCLINFWNLNPVIVVLVFMVQVPFVLACPALAATSTPSLRPPALQDRSPIAQFAAATLATGEMALSALSAGGATPWP
jgi:hypothetical protein